MWKKVSGSQRIDQGIVGWTMAPAARVHTMIGGLRFKLGLARTA